MIFFGSDVWPGKEIIFPNDLGVVWVLGQKLSEKSRQDTQQSSTAPNGPSLAWAVFECERKDGLDGKHAVKIYMQAPWAGTESNSAASRKAQADTNRSYQMAMEINTLSKLTQKGSKHTPHLVSVLHTQQGDDGYVPTGFISYILMTWCPGVPLGEKDYSRKSKTEQALIFKAFEAAIADVTRCDVQNYEPQPGDLIWDSAANKCYMVDFKFSGPPMSKATADRLWKRWGLFPGPP